MPSLPLSNRKQADTDPAPHLFQAQTYDAITLTLESTIQLTGKISALPEGKTAPDGHELQADWWAVVGKAPGDAEAFSNKLAEDSGPDVLADQRHLAIRGETASSVLKVRSSLLEAFRAAYAKMDMTEVTPPCMVQTQVEVSVALLPVARTCSY